MEVLPVIVYFVGVEDLNVGVNDNCDPSASGFNLSIHLFNLTGCEVLRIKYKVLISSSRVLVGPINIHPQNIHRETMLSKQTIPLHHHISIYISPLTEMETQCMNWGHCCIARYNCEVLLNFLDPVAHTSLG